MHLLLLALLLDGVHAYWQVPQTGFATMTHYTLGLDTIASCGCTGASTHYPTAAISSLAFGSTSQYGPSCGRCFNLSLINTFLSNPPFFPPNPPSIVVKITDQCPANSPWCEATADKPNKAGNFINFDLAFPNPAGAIPSDFFPSNVSEYGYSDFGVWNISYSIVDCTPNWAGSSNPAAMGSVTTLGDSVCCPGNVNSSTICPSFSEQTGTKPPDTGTTDPSDGNLTLPESGRIAIVVIVTLIGLIVLSMGIYYAILFWKEWKGSGGGGYGGAKSGGIEMPMPTPYTGSKKG